MAPVFVIGFWLVVIVIGWWWFRLRTIGSPVSFRECLSQTILSLRELKDEIGTSVKRYWRDFWEDFAVTWMLFLRLADHDPGDNDTAGVVTAVITILGTVIVLLIIAIHSIVWSFS